MSAKVEIIAGLMRRPQYAFVFAASLAWMVVYSLWFAIYFTAYVLWSRATRSASTPAP